MEEFKSDIVTDSYGQIQNEEELSFFQKLAGTIFYPGKTAKSHENKPAVLIPLLLVLAVSLGSVLLLVLNFDSYKEAAITTTEQMYANMGTDISRDQIEGMMGLSLKIGLATQPVMSLGGWLIGTIILFLAVRIFKGEGKLKHYITVTGYAYVISIPALLVMFIVTYITGGSDLNTSYTSLATILPAGMKGSLPYNLASMIEVFSIWQYAVVAIGVAQISKFTKTKAYTIVAALFAANVLYMGVLASAGSMFTK